MRAWKKCSKWVAALMLSVVCLLAGTGMTAFAYVDEAAVAELKTFFTRPIWAVPAAVTTQQPD